MQSPHQSHISGMEQLEVPSIGASQPGQSPTALSDDAWTTVNPSPVALRPATEPLKDERPRQSNSTPDFSTIPNPPLEARASDAFPVTAAPCGHNHQIELIRDAALHFSRRNGDLRPLRVDVLRLRSTASHERDNYLNHERFVRESQRDFMEELRRVAPRITALPEFDNLRALYDRIQADQAAVHERAQTCRELDIEVSHVEYDLFKGEDRLSKDADKLIEVLDDLTAQRLLASRSVSVAVSPMPSPSVRPATPKPRPEPLIDYLTKLSAVRNMRERIEELIDERRDEEAQAVLEVEQDGTYARERAEHDHDFQQMYTAAEADLAEAIEAATLARQACLDSGHNPDDYVNPDHRAPFPTDEILPDVEPSGLPIGSPSTFALDKPEYTTDMMPFLSSQDPSEPSNIRHIISGPLDADVPLPPRLDTSGHQIINRVADWVGKVEPSTPDTID